MFVPTSNFFYRQPLHISIAFSTTSIITVFVICHCYYLKYRCLKGHFHLHWQWQCSNADAISAIFTLMTSPHFTQHVVDITVNNSVPTVINIAVATVGRWHGHSSRYDGFLAEAGAEAASNVDGSD